MEPEQQNNTPEEVVETPHENNLKEQFTTVTPLSKYLAMALFIAMPFIGGWIGYQFAPEKVVEVERTVNKDYDSDGSSVTKVDGKTDDESFVTEESQQLGIFTGFFAAFEKEAWGETATCQTLIVTDGHENLTNYFVGMVERGNTVQMLDGSGRLVLNLPWNEIPEEDKEIILNSSEENQVSLALKKKVQKPTGAGACHSFFSYVGEDTDYLLYGPEVDEDVGSDSISSVSENDLETTGELKNCFMEIPFDEYSVEYEGGKRLKEGFVMWMPDSLVMREPNENNYERGDYVIESPEGNKAEITFISLRTEILRSHQMHAPSIVFEPISRVWYFDWFFGEEPTKCNPNATGFSKIGDPIYFTPDGDAGAYSRKFTLISTERLDRPISGYDDAIQVKFSGTAFDDNYETQEAFEATVLEMLYNTEPAVTRG